MSSLPMSSAADFTRSLKLYVVGKRLGALTQRRGKLPQPLFIPDFELYKRPYAAYNILWVFQSPASVIVLGHIINVESQC